MGEQRQKCPDAVVWRHDDLAADLARWLRYEDKFLTFLNLEIPDCEGAPEREPEPEYTYRPYPTTDEGRAESHAEYDNGGPPMLSGQAATPTAGALMSSRSPTRATRAAC